MDQVKDIISEDVSVTKKYRTWPDCISDYTTYALVFLGVILSLMYLSIGGELVYCNPVLDCPMTSWNKSNPIPKCDQYNNSATSRSRMTFLLIVKFQNINQYKYTNIYCSRVLLGYASFAVPFFFAASTILFALGRLWYVLPKVERHLLDFNDLIKEAEKLPIVNLTQSAIELCGQSSARRKTSLDKETNGPAKQGSTGNGGKNNEMYVILGPSQENERRSLIPKPSSSQASTSNYGGQGDSNQTPRDEYFKERQKLADAAAKLNVKDLLLFKSFQFKMKKWKENMKDRIHLYYLVLTVVRVVVGALCITANYHIGKKLQFNDGDGIPCKTTFHYDIGSYSEILCTVNGMYVLYIAWCLAFFFLSVNSICALFTAVWLFCINCNGRKCNCLSPYRLLLNMRSKFHTRLIDDRFNDEMRQIQTDINCPFEKLESVKGNSSIFPTYRVKENVSGIPSCLFSKKIDEQEWCLEVVNNVTFKDDDFCGFQYLEGLKELKFKECHSISCNVKLGQVENLRIENSVLQDKLQITSNGNNNNVKWKWMTPMLKSLSLVDVRPLKFLSLELRKITELSLSELSLSELSLPEMVEGETLNIFGEKFPSLESLEFLKCKMKDTALTVTGSFTKLTKLSLIDCGIQTIGDICCKELRILNLDCNNITLSKKDTDGEEREGQQREGQQREGQQREGQQREGQQREGQIQKPKLESVILTHNEIQSLQYELLERMMQKGVLDSLKLGRNKLRQEAILSDISLLYYFAGKQFAEELLESKEHGDYEIEEKESGLPSFKEDEEAKEQAVFYCDISHDHTRRRIMLYMSCIAQILKRNNYGIIRDIRLDKAELPKDFKRNICTTLLVFLAVQNGDIHSSLKRIADNIKKLPVAKLCTLRVICDFEFGTSAETTADVGKLFMRDEVKKLFMDADVTHYTLQRYPLMRQESLMKDAATRLKSMDLENMKTSDSSKILPFQALFPNQGN